MAQQHYSYQIKVTSQHTMSHVLFVTGILLISAKQDILKQYSPLKRLNEIGHRCTHDSDKHRFNELEFFLMRYQLKR